MEIQNNEKKKERKNNCKTWKKKNYKKMKFLQIWWKQNRKTADRFFACLYMMNKIPHFWGVIFSQASISILFNFHAL